MGFLPVMLLMRIKGGDSGLIPWAFVTLSYELSTNETWTKQLPKFYKDCVVSAFSYSNQQVLTHVEALNTVQS